MAEREKAPDKNAYGNVFRNKAYTQGRPEFRGDIAFSLDLLKKMAADAKAGKVVTLEVTLWPKEGQRAGRYYQVSMQQAGDYQKQAPQQPPEKRNDLDDDIPF